MKPSKILLTTVFGLLIPFSSVFCQKKKFPDPFPDTTTVPGYVVDLKNDTIKCAFQTTIFGKLKYKPVNSTAEFTRVDVQMLKLYYLASDSTTFVALRPDSNFTDKDFLKRLENGPIKLYEKYVVRAGTFSNGYYSGNSSNTTYYVSKDNKPVREIKSNSIINDGGRNIRKEYLLNLFSDDVDLAEKFKNEEDFSIPTLTSYIRSYNDYKLTVVKK